MNQGIRYVVGDATCPDGTGNKVIVHVCNDIGGWGKGFVMALSKRWPKPEAEYRAWYKSQDGFELGAVQLVQVEDDLWVANLVGQRGLKRAGGVPPIRYDAIRDGLAKVADFAKEHDASVHMPRIGCGLAGGKWEEVELLARPTAATKGLGSRSRLPEPLQQRAACSLGRTRVHGTSRRGPQEGGACSRPRADAADPSQCRLDHRTT